MEKIPTGIPGLDKMLEGGLVKGRPYLVAGGPGAGKTILGMQFLLEGVKNKERGIYIALEESAEQITQDMAEFGWNIKGLKIIDTFQDPSNGVWHLKSDSVMAKPEFSLPNLVNIIEGRMENFNPKRIVIDSLTSIRMLYENEIEARKEILSLMNFLARSHITTLLTSETLSLEDTLMEEFLASGVIKLLKIKHEGETVSAVSIEKMRGTSFDKHIRPMRVTDDGIVVFPLETIFG